jgi:hypothetical protein
MSTCTYNLRSIRWYTKKSLESIQTTREKEILDEVEHEKQ